MNGKKNEYLFPIKLYSVYAVLNLLIYYCGHYCYDYNNHATHCVLNPPGFKIADINLL